MDLHIGDILQLSCDPISVPILDTSSHYVTVRLPWHQVDPESEYGWDGNHQLPRHLDSAEWSATPFRFEGNPMLFVPGENRVISIPRTITYVAGIEQFDQPLDIGWLPRPTKTVSLLPQGEEWSELSEEQGFSYNLPGDEFISVERLFRPYAYLEDGDALLDSRGVTWRFKRPWLWEAADGEAGILPEWPLALQRSGRTSTTSHFDELRRWEEYSHVPAVSLEHALR
ncbi:hypothetical protein AB0I81_53880 [Nonomuraea sp. NPDC050404]|uniref:hypothetical protein n=1 Tax=Nonomuraea sp. NPDC050404 TaxID=3155783 RepID=UPI0033D2789F